MNSRQGSMGVLYRRATTVGAWALAILLTGCGGGGDTGSTSTAPGTGDTGNHYPLAVGDRWVYRKTASDGMKTLWVEEVMGTTVIRGETASVLRRRDAQTGQLNGTDNHYVKTDEGVFVVVEDAAQSIYGTPRLGFLQFPLVPGHRFIALEKRDLDFGEDLDGDGHNERMAVRSEVTVETSESVTVAAGRFDDAMRVRTVVEETVTLTQNGQEVSATTTYTDWYAAGVGVVKNREIGVYPTVTVTNELELTAYQVSGNSSDVTGPKVQSTAPASNEVVASTSLRTAHPLAVTFDRPLDPDSVVKNSLRVTDASGTVVTGRFSHSGAQITFTPDTDLPSGRYTAQLTAPVSDWIHQQIPQPWPAWSFVVDNDGPVVVSQSPAANAHNAPYANVITLEFNEELDPASVTSQAFLIKADESGSRYYPSAVSVSGRKVTLQIDIPLYNQGPTYEVTVNPTLTDRFGHPMAQAYQYSFHAYPGRFDRPVALTPTNWYTLRATTGDLDQDGHADVVAIIWKVEGTNLQKDLVIFQREQNGTLTPAHTVRLPTDMPYCHPDKLNVMDVTGDGRVDIITTLYPDYPSSPYRTPCSALIFEFSTTTGWSLTRRWPTSFTSVQEVADLNHDGRADLLTNRDDQTLEIWYQKSDGTLADPVIWQALPTGGVNWKVVKVVDLDGDGRMDVLASYWDGTRLDGPQLIKLAYQQSDSTLSPVQTTESPSPFSVESWVITDVNGDGQQDLIVEGSRDRDYAKRFIGKIELNKTTGPSTMSLVDVTLNMPPGRLVVGDVDGDGQADLLSIPYDRSMNLYTLTRTGPWQVNTLRFGANYIPDWAELADVTGDDQVDLVQLSANTLLLHKNAGPQPDLRTTATTTAAKVGTVNHAYTTRWIKADSTAPATGIRQFMETLRSHR